MAKKIFVKISMFDLNQPIFLADTEADIKMVAQPEIWQIENTLFALMENNPIDEIEFNGNEKYIQSIGEEWVKNLKSKYSNRNVRISINGKVFN